jgi:hypothetical protein
MPATPHIEKHFTTSESVRDVVIGTADGLTIPFALTAGRGGQHRRHGHGRSRRVVAGRA